MIAVDVEGAAIPAQILAIAGEVLTDARNHDSAALDQLLANPSQAAALNTLLAEPGVYQQIITLLTETHAAGEDGFEGWPGFLLSGVFNPVTTADAKALGVTSSQDYKGISISIGDYYDAKPYVPKLASIAPVDG